jgi:hypothetical protein
VRQELLPLLRELSPGIDDHLCVLADQLDAILSPASASLAKLPLLPLARASREALAGLISSRSRSARIPLKGDLVARWDPASRQLAIEAAPPLTHHSASREQGASAAPDVPPATRQKNK